MIKTFTKVLWYSLGLLVIVGCQVTDPYDAAYNEFFFREPAIPSQSAVTKLANGDSIELSVEVDGRMEVLNHRAGINDHGAVTLPLVGDVKISGLKLDEARNAISKAYGQYYVNPPVVMLSSVEDIDAGEWGFVTVTGRVGQPGIVRIPSASGMKLTAAIQESGGFAASAKVTGILVTRTDSSGQKKQVSVNYNQIGLEGNAAADITLIDGDIVYVPERIF